MKNNIINFYKKKVQVITMCSILKEIRYMEPLQLFEKYNISMSPPIDLSGLLRTIGISTIAKDFSKIENKDVHGRGAILGAAFSNKDALAIFYRASDTFHRQKFTIAHELGHCCLHCPNEESSHIEYRHDISIFSDISKYKKEIEANIFAGKLLIPKPSLEEEYSKMLIPSLTELSNIFKVSTSVMAARLDYLELPYFKDSIITDPIIINEVPF